MARASRRPGHRTTVRWYAPRMGSFSSAAAAARMSRGEKMTRTLVMGVW